ncbi:MAG TPA: gamma-glutamyl-gamma-aminobutyrate hydrolase [Lactobacillus sp.]|nr:gamma-glutamyl-gamma-aminobutyrate hydrolase [Lactobacillus sp.]
MKPIIGIGTNHLVRPSEHMDTNYVDYTQKNYVSSLVDAGALPFLIPIATPQAAAEYVDHVDAILLTGGQDVSPRLYGEDPLPQNGLNDWTRDRFEQGLIQAAIAKHKPIMGICRGIQILNAVLGGTNYQDIPTQVPNAIGHNQFPTAWEAPVHQIKTTSGSLLQQIYGTAEWVNSFHHQSVHHVAPGFTVTATAADGVIEAMEDQKRQIIAVQFHPEMMAATDTHAAQLFKAFVETIQN